MKQLSDSANPTFSVVIPYYNNGRFLYASVTSALRASLQHPLEVIVVDDGSDEPHRSRHLAEVERLGSNVHTVKRTNGGVAAARNTGLRHARGRFIQLLDADDILIPGKLDIQLQQFQINPRIDVSVSNYVICDGPGSNLRRDGDSISRFAFTLENFSFLWERGFSIPIHCCLLRREAIEGIFFDETLRAHEDWVFWCQLASLGRRFAFIDVDDAVYRIHGINATRSPYKMARNFLQAMLRVEGISGVDRDKFLLQSMDWLSSFYLKTLRDASDSKASQSDSSSLPSPGSNRQPAALATAAHTDNLERARYRPKLSVVVPVYNHYAYLKQCINSIASQLGGLGELVLVDDKSTDPRVRSLLAEEFSERTNVDITILFNDKNTGITASYNDALDKARGEYIAFVDCDDFLADGAVEKVLRALADREIDYLYTDRFGGNVHEWNHVKNGGYPNDIITGEFETDIERGMIASHLKVIRKRLIDELGRFPTAFEGVQDYWLALAAYRAGATFHHLREPLYYHRAHEGSVTLSATWSQFRASAAIRREHLVKRYRQASDFPVNQVAADYSVRDSDFRSRSTTLSLLQEAWKNGISCNVTLSSTDAPEFFNFVAEYISFFDAVHCEDRESYCKILQYSPFDISISLARKPHGSAVAVGG
jgi:O-antigen biosynthesis protein